MSTKQDGALSRARAALAEIAAERAELVRAICSVCGGVVGAGTGRVDGVLTPADSAVDADRTKRGRQPLAGWTRRHTACADPTHVVKALTGIKVTREIATGAIMTVHPVIEDTPDEGRRAWQIFASHVSTRFDLVSGWPGKPWAHVNQQQRQAFAAVVQDLDYEARLRVTPHRCVDGPCGACGVRLSLDWFDSPLQWKDGSPAPWCKDCGAVANRRPRTTDTRRLRAIALEALSGASGMGMADVYGDHMQMFCEIADAGHPGTDERWTYAADAWVEVRESARRLFASSLPEEIRAHYVQLARAEMRAHDARERHEREQAERIELQRAGWPSADSGLSHA